MHPSFYPSYPVLFPILHYVVPLTLWLHRKLFGAEQLSCQLHCQVAITPLGIVNLLNKNRNVKYPGLFLEFQAQYSFIHIDLQFNLHLDTP